MGFRQQIQFNIIIASGAKPDRIANTSPTLHRSTPQTVRGVGASLLPTVPYDIHTTIVQHKTNNG